MQQTTAIEYALRMGFMFIVGLLMIYFVLWVVAAKWTLRPLVRKYSSRAIALVAIGIAALVFLIGLAVGFSVYNNTSKSVSVATPDEVSTPDEAATEAPVYDTVFPGSNLHVSTSVDSYENSENAYVVPFNDGFVLIESYSYDGSYDDLLSYNTKAMKDELKSMFEIQNDIIDGTQGELTIKVKDSDSLAVKGYNYSGLVSSERYPSMSVSGVCIFDEEKNMVYNLSGLVGSSRNTEAVLSMEYIIADIISSMEVRVD